MSTLLYKRNIMKNIIRPALVLFILLTVLTGLIYPLLITEIGQLAFPNASSGSLIYKGDQIIGSELIGQSFTEPKYFWSRPSATSPMAYNASASSGSNLGPLNPALTDAIKSRIDDLKAADPTNKLPIPVDLITASASGLDPNISAAAALYQVHRIAKTRKLPSATVLTLVEHSIERPWFKWLGEEKVNVLKLNLALDQLK